MDGAGEGAVLGLNTTYLVQLVGAGWSTRRMARARDPVNAVKSSSRRLGNRASSTVSLVMLAVSFRARSPSREGELVDADDLREFFL